MTRYLSQITHLNTAVAPEVEAIEHLDFDPACTCHIPAHHPECPRPAKWIMVKRCGHTGFACEQHKQHIDATPNAPWHCFICGARWGMVRQGIAEWRRL